MSQVDPIGRAAMRDEIVRLRSENDRLRLGLDMTEGEVANAQAEIDRLQAENKTLRQGINWQELEEYACTGTDKPCGCHHLVGIANARLRAALEKIAKWANDDTMSAYAGVIARKALANEQEQS